MASGIARLGREKSIATLARKLFIIEGAKTAALRRRAERALLTANPRLAKKENFVPGMTIIVPAIAGVRTTKRVETSGADLKGLLNETAARLRFGANLISDGVERADARTVDALARLGDRGFRKVARAALPDSLELIEQSHKFIKEAQAGVDRKGRELGVAFGKALDEVERLSKLTKRTGGSNR